MVQRDAYSGVDNSGKRIRPPLGIYGEFELDIGSRQRSSRPDLSVSINLTRWRVLFEDQSRKSASGPRRYPIGALSCFTCRENTDVTNCLARQVHRSSQSIATKNYSCKSFIVHQLIINNKNWVIYEQCLNLTYALQVIFDAISHSVIHI